MEGGFVDHAAAQATFIEVTFGINMLFAVYREFRGYLHKNIDKRVTEFEARTKTIEPRKGEVDRLEIVKKTVSKFAKQHLRIQEMCVNVSTCLSLLAAIGCLIVLYWNLLEPMGHHSGWLILPLPIYFSASVLNYGTFRFRGYWKVRTFKRFIDEFEPPTIPPEIQDGGEDKPTQ